jgi:hypothetical protein
VSENNRHVRRNKAVHGSILVTFQLYHRARAVYIVASFKKALAVPRDGQIWWRRLTIQSR